MNNKRRRELENDPEARLTKEEMDKGYHFCYDWDEMVVGPNDPEMDCCTCVKGRDKV